MAPTDHPLSCPRDGGNMTPLDHKEISTSQCGTCRGLWIPKAHLVGRINANLIGKLYHVPATRITDLCCPVDASPLWEISPNGILLDRCLKCGGLWFDRGELETVLANVRYTTPPHRALAGAEPVAAKDLLLGVADSASGIELVIDIVVGIASTLAD